MESKRITQKYRDILEAIRIPGFIVSNPAHAASEAVSRAEAAGHAAATLSRKRQYAEYATLRAARPRHAGRAAPGWIDNIQSATERGFAQEAIFNIVFIFHARHVRRGEIVPSGGNFSTGDALADFDIDAFMARDIHSSGDISDLTMFTPDKKTIVVFSSKCLQHYTARGMDVADIKTTHAKEYPGTNLDIRFVVHDRAHYARCIGAAHNASTRNIGDHTIYDWDDIDTMIAEIRAARPDPFAALCRETAPGGAMTPIARISTQHIHAAYHGRVTRLRPRFGQAIVSARIAAAPGRRVINGAMCRFGKSFCMAIDILRSARRLFVFITTQPKTIPAIRAIFATHDEFKVFDMFDINSAAAAAVEAIPDGKKIIIFISVQALKRRAAAATNLGRHDPLCMFDEFHIGGGTDATTEILRSYNLIGAQMIFYSATFSKIAAHYNVRPANIITWGAEDNMLCARLGPDDISVLRAEHGADIVDAALAECDAAGEGRGREAIRAHYGVLPRMRFIINSPTEKCRDGMRKWAAADDTKRDMGYSFDAVKMIEPDEKHGGYRLVNSEYVRTYFTHMLGEGQYLSHMGVWVPVPGRGLLEQYKALYRADGQTTHGRIVPVYLGAGNAVGGRADAANDTLIGITGRLIIDCIAATATTSTLGYGTRYVIENYDAKEAKNPEKWFEKLCRKHGGIEFIILFLGRALTTGVTNRHCDLIKLTSRIGSADLFWQTICRAMNEAPERKKKYAYIAVDNYQSLAPMLDIVRGMKMPHESERGAWERLIGQNVFSIVDIHYDDRLAAGAVYTPPEPGALYTRIRDTVPYADNLRRFVAAVNLGNIEELHGHLIDIAKKAMADAAADLKNVNDTMERLCIGGISEGITRAAKEVELKRIAAELAAGKMKPKEAKKALEAAARTPEEWAAEREAAEARAADANRNSMMGMMDVIITTYVIMTISVDVRIEDMVEYLRRKGLWDTCIERCGISFGKDAAVAAQTLMEFTNIMTREDNHGTINESLTTLREALKRTEKKSEFYEVCIGCIATTVIERTKNAEVPTPISIVREMLAQIPAAAWRVDAKIWDPAVGKGVFMVVAYEILFDILAVEMPDPAARHIHILEKILYFSDINPFNIYVTQMILDPDGKAAMNVFLGDSLEQKFEEGFQFDMVIGNPPYNKGGVKSHTGSQLGETNETIWPHFINVAMDLLKPGGYLAFITPLRWLHTSHPLHCRMLDKHIVMLKLWDGSAGKKLIKGEIPISIYVVHNIDNRSNLPTQIYSILLKSHVNASSLNYLNPSAILPLAHHGIFDRLRVFIAEHNCRLDYKTLVVKDYYGDDISLTDLKYDIRDNYAVSTYRVKDGVFVRKCLSRHPDADKKKVIMANKGGMRGIFVEDGRLGLCTNHKFYILGDDLDSVVRLMAFKICDMVCFLTKYGMDFVDPCIFSYIPDIRKIPGGTAMTEQEFYAAIGFSEGDIAIIMRFRAK